MNQKQNDILKECLSHIEKNTGTLLEANIDKEILTMNLFSKGFRLWQTKQLTEQTIIDIASISLCLLLNDTEKKKP